MNDFTMKPEPLKRPMDNSARGSDVANLRHLLGEMNDPRITGAALPPEAAAETAAILGTPPPIPQAAAPIGANLAAPAAPQPIIAGTVAVMPKRLFFTGRLFVGKDYVADQIGSRKFGFADPMYYLATRFHGIEVTSHKNKDLPGMRAFLQQIGQWGRGHVDEQYPYVVARATWCQMIRSIMGESTELEVDWKEYGILNTIWSDSMVRRVRLFLADQPDARIANTNVRFKHEFTPLREDGWDHWHVVCSPQTWAKRLAEKKVAPNAAVLNDVSEALAKDFDTQVQKELSIRRNGPKLKVIWNDPDVTCPSQRLWTLPEFCDAVAQSDGTAKSDFSINTGE